MLFDCFLNHSVYSGACLTGIRLAWSIYYVASFIATFRNLVTCGLHQR